MQGETIQPRYIAFERIQHKPESRPGLKRIEEIKSILQNEETVF